MKISQRSGEPAAARGRERILVRVDVPAIRFISALMLLCVLGWFAVLVVRDHLGYDRVAPGRFGWSVALFAAAALIARGMFLGRPVTTGHAVTAAARGVRRAGCALLVVWTARQHSGRLQRARAHVAYQGATTTGAAGAGVGTGQRHTGGPVGAVCHAFEQELSLQHQQIRGDRLPYPAWVRRSQRRPDRRRHPIRHSGSRFRSHVPRTGLADHRIGLRPSGTWGYGAARRSASRCSRCRSGAMSSSMLHAFHPAGAPISKLAPSGAAHPQLRGHHRDRRRAARLTAALDRRADRGVARRAPRRAHRTRILHEP